MSLSKDDNYSAVLEWLHWKYSPRGARHIFTKNFSAMILKKYDILDSTWWQNKTASQMSHQRGCFHNISPHPSENWNKWEYNYSCYFDASSVNRLLFFLHCSSVFDVVMAKHTTGLLADWHFRYMSHLFTKLLLRIIIILLQLENGFVFGDFTQSRGKQSCTFSVSWSDIKSWTYSKYYRVIIAFWTFCGAKSAL